MISIVLEGGEWQQVLECMSYAPARNVNPLLYKIQSQLQQQSNKPMMMNSGDKPDGKYVNG